MFKPKNILFPTDFSKISLSVAQNVVDIAKEYGAKIHVLYVLEKIPPILTIRSIDLTEDAITKSLTEEADKSIQKTKEQLSSFGDVEIVTNCRKGIDYEEIVKYSKENSIDLIVLSTHGRTGLLHTLIGSVAEKVIRYSETPVLVIPSKSK